MKDEKKDGDEMVDGIVAAALRELEQQRKSAKYHADRLFNEAKARIKTLESAVSRDVFAEALVVAVGEIEVNQVANASTMGLGLSRGYNHYLTVVRSTLTPEEAQRRKDAHWKIPGQQGPPKLRAMLVVFEDRPPIRGAGS